MLNKFKVSNTLGLAFTMLSIGLTLSFQAVAQVPTFYCDNSNGSPKTMARTKTGVLQMFDWESHLLTEPNSTPIEKCKKHSAQLETYFQQDRLKFLTSGRKYGRKIICIAEYRHGPCEIPLFPVYGEHRYPIIKLLNLNFICPYNYDGACIRAYINVEGYLNQSRSDNKE